MKVPLIGSISREHGFWFVRRPKRHAASRSFRWALLVALFGQQRVDKWPHWICWYGVE